MWAGRDFHQRPQQGINDYFWMTHDGQGAGVKISTLVASSLTLLLSQRLNPVILK
ncbi:carbohydrate porin [Escherichia coli]